MKSPKKLLWTLAGIAAALLLVCVGIKLFDGIDPKAPIVSPLYGSMHGLPPTDIYVGTWDVLYTDVVKAYDKMKAASVEARLHVGEKMDHVYPVLPTPEGKAARKEIAEILSVW